LHGAQVFGRLLGVGVHNSLERANCAVDESVRHESALPLASIAFLSALEVNGGSLSG
jgi:hypothetical protein